MSIIATVAVPAAEFPLGALADIDEDVTLTVETTVPTSESVVPYFWAPASAGDAIVDSIEDEPAVATAGIVDETDDHVLVKVTWNGRVNGVLESIRERDAIVTSAVGTDTQWTFRLRFPSYEDLSAFYTNCVEQGISMELVQLHETVSPGSTRQFGLTTAQRELIAAAYRAGYFDVPRQTTLVELGEQLEVSDSAVSQRLRRGLATLIDSTVLAEQSEGGDGSSTGLEYGFDTEPEPDQ
ncbi:helix-turn-helix domain-containing protein [Natronorubrum texcoconense]|uniref:Predicted DNA binding protein, contains HTH domain n=1 Tax=Natronorubrum texcoconense TaxID=1095776 RepID=A0A1G9DW89_9EURY|nr:bacterio-opsin activator domain-containing protein [Natronorubrum texcoconense]SDK68118.1 Predicted DNA binding protein, contains HTH domain [Natronorubrum texcoconense]